MVMQCIRRVSVVGFFCFSCEVSKNKNVAMGDFRFPRFRRCFSYTQAAVKGCDAFACGLLTLSVYSVFYCRPLLSHLEQDLVSGHYQPA